MDIRFRKSVDQRTSQHDAVGEFYEYDRADLDLSTDLTKDPVRHHPDHAGD